MGGEITWQGPIKLVKMIANSAKVKKKTGFCLQIF